MTKERSLLADPNIARTRHRLSSIDAYRGVVMLLLLAEALQLCRVAEALPESGFWNFLCQQQSHAEWVGANLHDLIMPSFCFLVGVSLPFSIARRKALGMSLRDIWRHAIIRSFTPIALGLVTGMLQTHQTVVYPFYWVLPQIGLGYSYLFWLATKPCQIAWMSVILILIVYWLVFSLYPLPDSNFDYEAVGVSRSWLNEHGLNGFEAHWQKNSNFAWAVDVWLLNLYPRQEPFIGTQRGMTTLNFVPTVATMILGLMAGRILQSDHGPKRKLCWLARAGGIAMAGGLALSLMGLCPIVKELWTPSWVLFSGGWCFLFLSCSFLLVDQWGYTRLAFPFTIIGMNAIIAYLLGQIHMGLAFNTLRRLVGEPPFSFLGDPYAPLLYGIATVAGYWTALYMLYRRRIFLRV